MSRKRSYSAAERRAALRVLEEEEEPSIHEGRSSSRALKLASRAAGGASKRSLERWQHESNTDQDVQERLSKRGRHRLLSEAQEWLGVGYAINRRVHLKAVSRENIRAFCHGYMDLELRPQFISELMQKYGLSLQTVLTRNSRMVDPQTAEDALLFLIDLKDEEWEASQILVMDETGLWSNATQRKTYHFKNLYELPIIVDEGCYFVRFVIVCIKSIARLFD